MSGISDLSTAILVISVIAGISGIAYTYSYMNNSSLILTKEDLASKFDALQSSGCYNLNYSNDNVVSAGLVSISGPEFVNESYYNLPDEYWYNLTFQGNTKTQIFYMVLNTNISKELIPYKEGQFYKFDFGTLCGSTFSLGPHGGGYIFFDNNFTTLKTFN